MRPSLRVFAALLAAGIPAAGAASCGSKTEQGAPGAAGSASASAAPTSTSSAETSDDSDQIRPVYPVTKDPVDPLAQRFCETIHELPANRKAECCTGGYSMRLTSECSRVLSYALRAKAVALDPADVDRCAEAMATLMRRTERRTWAPIFRSARRSVPQVASANWVWARPMRRRAQSRT